MDSRVTIIHFDYGKPLKDFDCTIVIAIMQWCIFIAVVLRLLMINLKLF